MVAGTEITKEIETSNIICVSCKRIAKKLRNTALFPSYIPVTS